MTGETSAFDFGEEGDKTVNIVTDPVQFNSTRESGDTTSNTYWGKNFLTINVDNADQPINIDIRPGSYNAAALAAEVQRAINTAYGDDKKIQVVQNVDDTITIDLLKLNADGTSTGLTTPISVDLLSSSYVSSIENLTLTGASPDFTKEQFLAHTQARLNATLNDYAVDATNDTVDNATALGVSNKLFARGVGQTMTGILEFNQAFSVSRKSSANNLTSVTDNNRFMTHSYFGSAPQLNVYDNKNALSANASSNLIEYDQSENTVKFYFGNSGDPGLTVNEKIRMIGKFATADATNSNFVNGREFTIISTGTTSGHYYVECSTSGMNFPDADFNLSSTNNSANAYSDESDDLEAFFEGSSNVFKGATDNFSSSKVVIREIGSENKHSYTNKQMTNASVTNGATNIITIDGEEFALTDSAGSAVDSAAKLGLGTSSNEDATFTVATHWVDEKDPPIEVTYDELNQRLQFEVDRNVLGTGTDSNFNSFKLSGAATASSTNNLGIPALASATETLIKGGEKFSGGTFVADGAEIQLNDKRFGIKVEYNSELQAFDFKSGTTGEAIAANGAIGVTTAQSASSIVVGRYSLSTTNGSPVDTTDFFAGDNHLLGIGANKTTTTTDAAGLAAKPAVATGAAATEALTEVFKLTANNNENIFNVSVNGVSGILEIPPGFYVGSTLADALQERINQVEDSTGTTTGGITVSYNSTTNNFTFYQWCYWKRFNIKS